VLDRIVGFELSPVLWKKIKPALSAGRVQSVTTRLVCEREREIQAFRPEAFFRVNALFLTVGNAPVKAEGTVRFKTDAEARAFLQGCVDRRFRVSGIAVKPVTRKPQPPFTTSTLQQEAGRRLGFSVSTTMRVAQRLYEEGQITYMRTDSTNLSELAIADIAKAITEDYGPSYQKTRRYHTNAKGAQEAHEAIRPTYVSHRTISGTPQEQKLYDLIWKRAVASQMSDALLEKTNVDIDFADSQSEETAPFRAEGETVKFEGFMRAYGVEISDDTPIDDGKETILPPMAVGDSLDAKSITATERFTQAPPRYTEPSLVKKMEDLDIGRPSTYASTVSTIQARGYVEHGDSEGTPRQFHRLTLQDGKVSDEVLTENSGSTRGKLVPTDVGMIVNDFLEEFFPDIMDYNFTARVEEKFDEIAEGKLPWQEEIGEFYGSFHPLIEKVNTMRSETKGGRARAGH